jgi:beta-glucanase (GH16 family)
MTSSKNIFLNKWLSSLFFVLTIGILGLNISCSDTTEDVIPIIVLPQLSVNDVTTEQSKNQESIRFYVALDKTTSSNVSFDYKLVEGTAKFNTDFIENEGSLMIPANQTSTSIEVFIKGGELRQPNIEFTIQILNAKGCVLKKPTATCTIITENGSRFLTAQNGYSTPTSYSGKTLVWMEEFDVSNLNLSHWNQEIGNGSGGWGNNELQYYTNNKKNTFISDGNLIIEARKDAIDGFNYSSGRMTTKSKKEFTFGRIDIRAKLPKGKGIWPALWMLGANINSAGWPSCGEIDIMELIGSEPNKVHGTLHWRGINGHSFKGGSSTLPIGDFSQEFHVFSLIWEKDKIQWLLDDKVFYTMQKSDFGTANYPFNAPQFFILNLAVGGNWPGQPDASTVFPQRLIVDYIRVFQ